MTVISLNYDFGHLGKISSSFKVHLLTL